MEEDGTREGSFWLACREVGRDVGVSLCLGDRSLVPRVRPSESPGAEMLAEHSLMEVSSRSLAGLDHSRGRQDPWLSADPCRSLISPFNATSTTLL